MSAMNIYLCRFIHVLQLGCNAVTQNLCAGSTSRWADIFFCCWITRRTCPKSQNVLHFKMLPLTSFFQSQCHFRQTQSNRILLINLLHLTEVNKLGRMKSVHRTMQFIRSNELILWIHSYSRAFGNISFASASASTSVLGVFNS